MFSTSDAYRVKVTILDTALWSTDNNRSSISCFLDFAGAQPHTPDPSTNIAIHVYEMKSKYGLYLCNRRGATLLIHEARLEDAGAYSCHVINVIGSAVSAASHVTVAAPGLVVFSRSYWYRVWSAIGIILSSTCLPVKKRLYISLCIVAIGVGVQG